MSTSAFEPLKTRWNALAPRERWALSLAAWVVGLGLLWWGGVSPALQTLRVADAQQVELDRQLQIMQGLQSQAKAFQSQSKLSPSDALRALETSVKQRLGAAAQMNVVGDRITVNLKAVSGEALAQWLAQARANAHALPTEARLTRTAPSSAAGSAPAATWDGSIVLRLP